MRQVSTYGRCPLARSVHLRRCPLAGDVHLGELSACNKCPLKRGVRLREVSFSGGPTVLIAAVISM